MNKKFLTSLILIVVLVGIFVPNIAHAWISEAIGSLTQTAGNITFGPLIALVGYLLTVLSNFALIVSGWILDGVVSYTIVDMTKNIGGSDGIGKAITESWTVLRDIANMVFIFVLLYAAFKAMFDSGFGGFGTTVKNIIIIALLINFSLFFSKVVIDASNIVSVGFYRAIAQNEITSGSPTMGGTANFKGISGGYMRMLGLQTWADPSILNNGLDVQKIFVTATMSSIFTLGSAVIFLVMGVMFATRFILLIFLMILSPLAFIAYAIPGQGGYFKKWWESLTNQALFAPLFFALTWVAFKLGNSLVKPKSTWVDMIMDPVKFNQDTQGGTVSLLINYVLVMGFAITALILSKQIASKTAGFKQISGGVGTAALGGLGFAGRNTLGWGANKIANDKDLQARAASGDRGARMKLATAQSLAGSSFDVRAIPNTKVGKAFGADTIIDTNVTGKAGGEGGFNKTKEFWTGTERRRKRTDEVMKKFKNNYDVLANHIESLKDSDQQYMYEKMSARERVLLDEALDRKHLKEGTPNETTPRLRGKLATEEREKTEKAGKDAAKETRSKQFIDEIENLVRGDPAAIPGTRTTTNPAGTSATFDDLLTGRNALRVTDARKLSIAALNNDAVIIRLSPRHLADIITNKDDIDDATVAHIVNVIQNPPPYPLQPAQQSYINGVKAIWGIP